MNASHSKVILDGLLDGMEGNALGAFQGGNGAGNFEDAGVGAGGWDGFGYNIDDNQSGNSCQGMAWLLEGRSMAFSMRHTNSP